MPIFISRGRFTSDAVKGMLAKPENREASEVGSPRGHHDWPAVGEFPDAKAAASAMLAAAGGGSLSDVETTIAMSAKDAFTTFESAAKAAKAFRSAGRS
jgi:uncharacterized protein with GYD domain